MDALDQLALMLASALRACPTDVTLLEPPEAPPTVLLRHRTLGASRSRRGRRGGLVGTLRQTAVDPFGQRR